MRQGQDWHGAETMAPIPSAFKYFIGAAAIFIAGCSAFFSVCGLGMLFVGSATAVMIMASSLEVGKLVAASFLYWFWGQLTIPLRIYLTLAVLTLIGITSLGNYGYLARAYERTHTGVGQLEEQIAGLQKEIADTQRQIDDAHSRIGKVSADGREDVGVVRQHLTQATALFEQSLSRLQEQRKTIQDRRDKDMQAVAARIGEQAEALRKDIASEDAAIEKLQQNLATLDEAVNTYTQIGGPGLLPIGGPWIFHVDGVKRGQELREQQRSERETIATGITACRSRQDQLRAAHGKRVEAADREIASIRDLAAQDSSRLDTEEQALRKSQAEAQAQLQARIDGVQTATAALRNTGDTQLEAQHQRIRTCSDEIRGLQSQIATTDIGSYRFVARAFDAAADDVVKWLILALVIVFDPLAVCLAVGFNVALLRERHGRVFAAPPALPPIPLPAANEPPAADDSPSDRSKGRWTKFGANLLLGFLLAGTGCLGLYWVLAVAPRQAQTAHARWIPGESVAVVTLRPAELLQCTSTRSLAEWSGGTNRTVLGSLLTCAQGDGFDPRADVYLFAKVPAGAAVDVSLRPVIFCGLIARIAQPAAAEATLSSFAEQVTRDLRPTRDPALSLARNRTMIRYGEGRYMDPEGGFFTFAIAGQVAILLVEFEGNPQAPQTESEIRHCLADGRRVAPAAFHVPAPGEVLGFWFDAGRFFRAVPKNAAASARYQQIQRYLGFDMALGVCPAGGNRLNVTASYNYQADRFNRPGLPSATEALASLDSGREAGIVGRLMDRCADTLDFDSLVDRLRAQVGTRDRKGLQDLVVEKTYSSARSARFILTACCSDKSKSPLLAAFQSLWQ